MRVTFAIILLICMGCKRTEFYGTYYLNSPGSKDTLIINSNYTYTHITISTDGIVTSKKGSWQRGDSNDGFVEFNNFDWQIGGFGFLQSDSMNFNIWPVKIEYEINGNPFLIIDYDRGLKYKFLNIRN